MKKIIFILLILFLIFLFSFKNWFENFLTTLKEKWEGEIIPIFQKIWEWFKENVWTKITTLFKKEIEKREPEVKEEFQKKTEEMKKETPQFLGKIWEKLSALLRK